jgi:DNA-binding LytR/AlgR family response regulator
MTNIKVGIVEDEMIIAHGIADALQQLGYAVTEPANNYSEALAMIEEEKPDILLLDIHLGGKKDGIDLAWKIREEYNIPFIFLTANADAATVERAKKTNPPAYLVKPFSKDELYASIEICLHNYIHIHKNKKPETEGNYLIKDALFIKQGQYFHKVPLNDILYLESENVYVFVHTVNNKLLVRSTIQHYLDLIGSPQFFRVHRSYAVNIQHVNTINSEIIIIGGREIPIGKAYRDELLSYLRLG